MLAPTIWLAARGGMVGGIGADGWAFRATVRWVCEYQ